MNTHDNRLEIKRHWGQRPLYFNPSFLELDESAYQLNTIQALIPEMPVEDIIYRNASAGINKAMKRLPLDKSLLSQNLSDLLAGEVSSLMLQDVNQYDKLYQQILDQCVDFLAQALEIKTTDFYRPSASFFLSSPSAISSYHTDREQNFLVHLLGEKTLSVFRKKENLLDECLVAFFRKRKGIHFEYENSLQSSAQTFEMSPGTTLYLPRLWPHWVQNGNQVSVSLSLNLFLKNDYIMEKLYLGNDKLRRITSNAFTASKPVHS